MKRVDFDPNGERNPQNRGKSKYVRISWDEALDIIASEMKRIKEKYGPTAILYQCDQHGENKIVQACHGAGRKLLRAVGRLHPADPPARQLGRLVLGQQARLGLRAGRPEASRATSSTTSPRTPTCSSSGAATRRPPRGAGRASSPAA